MAAKSSAATAMAPSSSDIPMPKKRMVAAYMNDALRFATQRFMKDMTPMLMMMPCNDGPCDRDGRPNGTPFSPVSAEEGEEDGTSA